MASYDFQFFEAFLFFFERDEKYFTEQTQDQKILEIRLDDFNFGQENENVYSKKVTRINFRNNLTIL